MNFLSAPWGSVSAVVFRMKSLGDLLQGDDSDKIAILKMRFDSHSEMDKKDAFVRPAVIVYTAVLASLFLTGCAGPGTQTSRTAGGIEQLRDTWVNRNGTVGSNVTIRVWRYNVDASAATLSFCLNENDLRNPCGGSAEYRLPIERLISSNITPDACPRDQAVWELVIDTTK